MKQPLVSIIVPTYNSEKKIKKLLESASHSQYKNLEIIINDEKKSKDHVENLLKMYTKRGLIIRYYRENISMAQGRRQGAKYARGEILLHLDSDMEITSGLLGEIVDLLGTQFDALIVPEESVGPTFWAKCKCLEKKCYEGISQIESLRCIRRSVYEKIGGHDEKMIFSEDKDLDIRVRKAGYSVGRTKNKVIHDEGSIHFIDSVKKKMTYSNTANIFASKHPEEFRWQRNIFNRYLIYIKNIKYLFFHPLLYSGMFLIKTGEFTAGSLGYLYYKMRPL